MKGFFLDNSELSEIRSNSFWAKKVSSDQYDIVIAGDSRVYRGISAKFLKKGLQTSESVYNLGFSSAIFNRMYFEYIKKMVHAKKKSIIIMGVTLHSITERENEHLKETVQKYQQLEFVPANFKLFYESMISPIELFTTSQKNKKKSEYIQKYHISEGWVESDKISHDIEKTLKSYKKSFMDKAPTFNDLKNFIRLTCDLSQRHSVYILEMPINDRLKSLEEAYSPYSYDEMFKEISNSKCAKFIELNHDVLSNTRSYDGSHIDGKSAKQFSRAIGEQIRNIK